LDSIVARALLVADFIDSIGQFETNLAPAAHVRYATESGKFFRRRRNTLSFHNATFNSPRIPTNAFLPARLGL
jgi:hypothetical protein